MSLPIWQATIVNEFGDIIPSATITVKDEATGLGLTVYSDRNGASDLGTNGVFTAGADGFAQFFAPAGNYSINAKQPINGFEKTFDFVVLTGTAATKNTGTGAGDVPLNSDLPTFGSAATKDTGTGAGDVPLNADVRVPRNRIVNPTGTISQENGDGVVTVDNSAEFYLADEIHTRSEAGAGGQFTTEATNLDGLRARKLTVTSATTNLTGSNDAGRIVSKLESINVFDLNGGAVTWTRVIKTNFTGKLSLAFRGSANTRSYVTELDVVSGVTKKHVVVLDFEAATVDSNNNSIGIEVFLALDNNGSDETATLDQWQAGTFLSSATATNWTQTTGNYIEFTAHGLYKGSIAPELQPNSYAYDLAECRNYFRRLGGAGTEFPLPNLTTFTTNQGLQAYIFDVPMRATPTFSISSQANVNFIYRGVNISGSSGFVVEAATPFGLSIKWTATLVQDVPAQVRLQPAGFIDFNSRL